MNEGTKEKNRNKIIILMMIFIIFGIILFFIFSYLFSSDKYNYKHIKGNSYVANDNSYLVLNNDKTFYWYQDKDNKDVYYYGIYTVYRGENAIKYITSDIAIYNITE